MPTSDHDGNGAEAVATGGPNGRDGRPRGARLLPMLMALPLALATAASYLGSYWWGLALIEHFRPHLAAASLLTLGAALLWRDRITAGLGIALLAINTAPLLPYLRLTADTKPLPPANLRVLTYNMHREATDRALFRDLIRRERPDLVVISEISDNVGTLVEEIPELPPYRAGEVPALLYGVVLLSRWPVSSWRVERSADGAGSVLTADLCDGERWVGCLRVVGLHAAPPFAEDAITQSQQLEIAARLCAGAPGHRVVLAGDLALTPWSPRFEELLAGGNLVDTAPRRGLTATWLSPIPFLGLALDHVLVSPGIVIIGNRLGSDAGSTHFPVIADLAIPLTPP